MKTQQIGRDNEMVSGRLTTEVEQGQEQDERSRKKES